MITGHVLHKVLESPELTSFSFRPQVQHLNIAFRFLNDAQARISYEVNSRRVSFLSLSETNSSSSDSSEDLATK
jgi:hypothetical protein